MSDLSDPARIGGVTAILGDKKETPMTKEDMAKLTVEVPKWLWKAAKQRALDDDCDLRDVVIAALEKALGQKKAGR